MVVTIGGSRLDQPCLRSGSGQYNREGVPVYWAREATVGVAGSREPGAFSPWPRKNNDEYFRQLKRL